MRLLPAVFLTLVTSCSTFGQTYTSFTVAGNGAPGYGGDNGTATSAGLNYPYGVAVDSAGNLYIADFLNQRIRKVSNGVITTVAGNGTGGYGGDNGPATSAELFEPVGVAIDSAGNLYIVDSYNNRIRKVSNGVITTVAGNGTQGFSGDNGPATSAQLTYPEGVAVDAAGIGPVAAASATTDPATGKLATTIGGVQVLFNLIYAPNAAPPAACPPAARADSRRLILA